MDVYFDLIVVANHRIVAPIQILSFSKLRSAKLEIRDQVHLQRLCQQISENIYKLVRCWILGIALIRL